MEDLWSDLLLKLPLEFLFSLNQRRRDSVLNVPSGRVVELRHLVACMCTPPFLPSLFILRTVPVYECECMSEYGVLLLDATALVSTCLFPSEPSDRFTDLLHGVFSGV